MKPIYLLRGNDKNYGSELINEYLLTRSLFGFGSFNGFFIVNEKDKFSTYIYHLGDVTVYDDCGKQIRGHLRSKVLKMRNVMYEQYKLKKNKEYVDNIFNDLQLNGIYIDNK